MTARSLMVYFTVHVDWRISLQDSTWVHILHSYSATRKTHGDLWDLYPTFALKYSPNSPLSVALSLLLGIFIFGFENWQYRGWQQMLPLLGPFLLEKVLNIRIPCSKSIDFACSCNPNYS